MAFLPLRKSRRMLDILARSFSQLAFSSSVLVRHVPKSAKDMLVVEFTDLEIGSAAERYGASTAKYPPKPLCTLYRGGRAGAVNGFTSRNAAVNEIEGQSHEGSDLCHRLRIAVRNRPVCRCCPRLPVSRRHKVSSSLFANCLTDRGFHLLI